MQHGRTVVKELLSPFIIGESAIFFNSHVLVDFPIERFIVLLNQYTWFWDFNSLLLLVELRL